MFKNTFGVIINELGKIAKYIKTYIIMNLEYYISGGALIVSIVFGIIAVFATQKANRLQNEVLKLSKQTNEFEIKQGEILIMSLISRYFVIQLNNYEQSGRTTTDNIAITHYTNELKQLNDDISSLITNQFYIEIFEKFPEINLLWMSLRYSIIGQENSKTIVVNPQTFQKFYDLYFKIKNEIKDNKILDNQYYKQLMNLQNF